MKKRRKSSLLWKIPMEIKLKGFEIVEKRASKGGNSGRVYVPINWVGKKVRSIRVEE